MIAVVAEAFADNVLIEVRRHAALYPERPAQFRLGATDASGTKACVY